MKKKSRISKINEKDAAILFIQLPPWGTDTPPLSVACLSSYLRDKGIHTAVYDMNIKLFNTIPEKYQYLWSMSYSHLWRQREAFRQIYTVLSKYITTLIDEIVKHPAPIVGIGLPTDCSDLLLQIVVESIKKGAPAKKIILGGVSISIRVQRDAVLTQIGTMIDYCVIGAGEEALYELMQQLVDNKEEVPSPIGGVLPQDMFSQSSSPRIVENLDILPFPTFEEFSLREYGKSHSLVMEFARGCIGNCPFCDFKSIAPYFRSKSAQYIVDQIKFYIERYRINHISVCDAAVNGNMRIVTDVCDLLLHEKLTIAISALAIPRKEMNETVLKKMRAAGFIRLEYGIESGSNQILKSMRKIFTVEHAEHVVRDTHAAGIATYLYFIVGYPGEKLTDLEATKQFLRRAAPFITMIKSINPLFLMAGSELHTHHERYGIILPAENADSNWSIPHENNTREVREQRVVEIKTLVSELSIPFTEETECCEFTSRVLQKKGDIEVSSDAHDKVGILLLNLPWRKGEQHGVRAGSRWPHLKDTPENIYLPFPFFLAYTTSLLKKHHYNAKLLDAIAEGHNQMQTLDYIADHDPSYIIIETSTVTLRNDIEFINSIPPRHTVIVTGPEAQLASVKFLKEHPRINFAIKGEYEFAVLELMHALNRNKSLKSIGGLRYRINGTLKANRDRKLSRIDDLPWPERDDVPLYKYNDTPGGIPLPSVQVLASRGCPFNCIFCLWPSVMYGGRNYRNRSYKDVLDEMEYLVSKGFKSIYFDDDTFGLDKIWVMSFMNELIKRNNEGRINVPWAMMTRADCMDKIVLRQMKRAGLAAVKYGVESASHDILKMAGKKYDQAKVENIIYETKRLGIKVHLTFTFGLPGETHRTARDTIHYACSLEPDSVQFSIATPFPGTPYYKEAKRTGTLVSENWSEYDGNYKSVVRTEQLSPDELLAYRDDAYRLWGIYRRFRHKNRLLFYMSKVYVDHRLLGIPRMHEIFMRYLIADHWLARKLHQSIESIREFMVQRLRYLGIFHGERAFAGPGLIQIDLTNNCNNDCIGCWCNSPLLEEKRMRPPEKLWAIPLNVVQRSIDDVYAMGTRHIYLAGGGEPFMYPDIMKVIRYIKLKGICLYINTNFTLVTMRIIQDLVALGVDHLTVSVWAGTPATYSATHPNKDESTFITLENMLKYLQSIKKPGCPPYVKIYHVISNMNYHELDYMYDFVLRTKSESVEFTVLDTIPGKTDVLMLTRDQMAELRESAHRLKQRYEELKQRGQKPPVLFRFDQFLRRISDSDCVAGDYDKNIIDSMPCYVGWTFSRIMPDGSVNGCLKTHRIPIDNVNNERFVKIWNSPAQRHFRKRTYVYVKSGPFFSAISNDPDATIGCYKGCDNLGYNETMHTEIKRLWLPEKVLLKGIAALIRMAEKWYAQLCGTIHTYQINTRIARTIRTRWLNTIEDFELRGIAHGYKTFRGPTHVVIDLTNRCNNSCIGCWMYSPLLDEKKVAPEVARQELSERDVCVLLKDLKKMGTTLVRFTGGGEPLLHPAFDRCVRYAKECGLRVAVTTSMPWVPDRVIQALFDVDELAVSLWAGDRETYHRMHPNQSRRQFDYVRRTLEYIRERRNPYQIMTFCYVITNKNYASIDKMIYFAQTIRIEELYFTMVDPIAGKTDSLLLNETQRKRLYNYFVRLDKKTVGFINVENHDGFLARLRDSATMQSGNYDSTLIDEIPCYMGWHFSRILANGDVVPCCRGLKKVMGNIRRDRFQKIWNGIRQQEFRNKALRLSKFSPYFDDIECFKMCDNLMQNRKIHERMQHIIM